MRRTSIPLFRPAAIITNQQLKRRVPSCSSSSTATNTAVLLNAQTDEAAAGSSESRAAQELLRCPAKKVDPPLLFPWRHTSHLPRRLVERQKNHVTDWMSYDTSTFCISAVTGNMFLGVPFTRLLGESWKQELAESCSWAFAQGVAGILSNVYHVPFEKIASNNNDDDDNVSLQFDSSTTTSSTEDSPKNGNYTPPLSEETTTTMVESMMETKLRNLYSSAHKSGKNQIQVHLASTPTGSHLHSLHALPGLSRSLAENHPDMLRDIEMQKAHSPSTSAHIDRILDETGRFETTLFAEVLVYCDESFWVRNLETGATVQGHSDGKVRQVVHGVRFERVMRWAPGEGKQAKNWCITDIDDLLDGNRWFSPPGVIPWHQHG